MILDGFPTHRDRAVHGRILVGVDFCRVGEMFTRAREWVVGFNPTGYIGLAGRVRSGCRIGWIQNQITDPHN